MLKGNAAVNLLVKLIKFSMQRHTNVYLIMSNAIKFLCFFVLTGAKCFIVYHRANLCGESLFSRAASEETYSLREIVTMVYFISLTFAVAQSVQWYVLTNLLFTPIQLTVNVFMCTSCHIRCCDKNRNRDWNNGCRVFTCRCESRGRLWRSWWQNPRHSPTQSVIKSSNFTRRYSAKKSKVILHSLVVKYLNQDFLGDLNQQN